MSKIKVGDRIKVFPRGQIGTVITIDRGSVNFPIGIKLDTPRICDADLAYTQEESWMGFPLCFKEIGSSENLEVI